MLHTILVLMAIASTALCLLIERENVVLRKQKDVLILKNDSLHMLQLKTRKDLIYSNNKIDSLQTNYAYKKRRR